MAGAVAAFLATRHAADLFDSEEDSDIDSLSDSSSEEQCLTSIVQLGRVTVDQTWELDVRKLSGESLKLPVHSEMPISDLRRAIEVHLDIYQQCQRWIAGDRVVPCQGTDNLVQRGLGQVCELTVIHIGHEPLTSLPCCFDVKLSACNMRATYRDSSRVSLFRIRADVQDRQMTVQRSTRNHSETYMYDLKNKSTKYSGGHCLCVPSRNAKPLEGDPLSDFVDSWQYTSEVDFKPLWRLSSSEEAAANFWCDPFISPDEDYVEVKVDVALGTLKAKIVRLLIDREGKPKRAAVKHDGNYLHEYAVEVREWDPQADAAERGPK